MSSAKDVRSIERVTKLYRRGRKKDGLVATTYLSHLYFSSFFVFEEQQREWEAKGNASQNSKQTDRVNTQVINNLCVVIYNKQLRLTTPIPSYQTLNV